MFPFRKLRIYNLNFLFLQKKTVNILLCSVSIKRTESSLIRDSHELREVESRNFGQYEFRGYDLAFVFLELLMNLVAIFMLNWATGSCL